MALGNKRNILVGAAAVFVSDDPAVVETPITLTDVTRATWVNGADADGDGTSDAASTAGFRNVGFTQDGLEVSTDPSYGEVEVDQLLDAALIFKDGMGLSISTTFAEATLENLLVAWGQEDDITDVAGSRQIDILGGALGEAPLERSLIAIGNSPRLANGSYGERVYYAYRVMSVESTSVSIARADATTIPVTFRAMPDNSGKYGVVRDTVDA